MTCIAQIVSSDLGLGHILQVLAADFSWHPAVLRGTVAAPVDLEEEFAATLKFVRLTQFIPAQEFVELVLDLGVGLSLSDFRRILEQTWHIRVRAPPEVRSQSRSLCVYRHSPRKAILSKSACYTTAIVRKTQFS